jgi:hypothetical protein
MKRIDLIAGARLPTRICAAPGFRKIASSSSAILGNTMIDTLLKQFPRLPRDVSRGTRIRGIS